MALVATTTFTIPASTTGLTSIVIPNLGWTPKAARFVLGSASADEELRNHVRASIGVATASGQWVIVYSSRSDQGISRAHRQLLSDRAMGLMVAGDTPAYQVVIDAVDDPTTGPTLNGWNILITLNTRGSDALGQATFYGGDDLQANVGTVAFPSGSTAAVAVNAGFQPNLVYAAACNLPVALFGNPISDNMVMAEGWAYDAGGATPQFGRWRGSRSAVQTTECANIFSTDRVIKFGSLGAKTSNYNVLLDNWGANGFDLTPSGGQSDVDAAYLALDTGDSPAWCGEIPAPVDAGANWVRNEPGFEPIWVGAIANRTRDAEKDAYVERSGVWSGAICEADAADRENSGAMLDQGLQGTVNARTAISETRFVRAYTTPGDIEYDLGFNAGANGSGFTPTGWEIKAADILNSATEARPWIGVAIGTGAAPAPSAALSGTILDATTEQDIRDGGRIIQVDITGATLVP